LILAIGLLSNLLCVLVFNQALLELVINTGVVKKMKFLRLIPKTTIGFLGGARSHGGFAVRHRGGRGRDILARQRGAGN